MIIALLFLILFALLFPKVLKFLLALAFIGSIVALSQAHAEKAKPSADVAVATAITNMKTYANNCASSVFKNNVGTFKAQGFYHVGITECTVKTIHNTFPWIAEDGRIMARFLVIEGLNDKEQDRELASNPDATMFKALITISNYVTTSFREAMIKHCTHLGGKGEASEVSCK